MNCSTDIANSTERQKNQKSYYRYSLHFRNYWEMYCFWLGEGYISSQ